MNHRSRDTHHRFGFWIFQTPKFLQSRKYTNRSGIENFSFSAYALTPGEHPKIMLLPWRLTELA
jgi:hypothetical protein